MVLGSAAPYVGLGLTVGVLCTLAWDGVFGSGLVNIRLADPAVLGPVITVLVLVAFAACLAPARRATRLDPVATLRQD
jgi:ABC-type antimicrobial peptide transport system permease subunit